MAKLKTKNLRNFRDWARYANRVAVGAGRRSLVRQLGRQQKLFLLESIGQTYDLEANAGALKRESSLVRGLAKIQKRVERGIPSKNDLRILGRIFADTALKLCNAKNKLSAKNYSGIYQAIAKFVQSDCGEQATNTLSAELSKRCTPKMSNSIFDALRYLQRIYQESEYNPPRE